MEKAEFARNLFWNFLFQLAFLGKTAALRMIKLWKKAVYKKPKRLCMSKEKFQKVPKKEQKFQNM